MTSKIGRIGENTVSFDVQHGIQAGGMNELEGVADIDSDAVIARRGGVFGVLKARSGEFVPSPACSFQEELRRDPQAVVTNRRGRLNILHNRRKHLEQQVDVVENQPTEIMEKLNKIDGKIRAVSEELKYAVKYCKQRKLPISKGV